MNLVFKTYLDEFVIVFIDNIFIYSKSSVEHEKHLGLVIQRLREKQLYDKLKKCELWPSITAFLGHMISKKGVSVDAQKIKTIMNWARPINVSKVRSFLGLMGYY